MQKIKEKMKYSSFPFGAYLLLAVIILVFLGVTNGSVSPTHLLNIARSAAPLGIVAIGQTIALLVGGLDLSVGATMSMVNLVSASMMAGKEENILPAVAVCMLLCAGLGIMKGLIITKFKMQPFLVTLAVSIIIEGGYYVYTQGIPSGSVPESFRYMAEGWLGGIPVAFLLWLCVWGILSVILRRTVYGRKLYYTGANSLVAKMSGYHSDAIVISAYVLTSVLAGFAGLMLTAYIGVASMGAGEQYQLNSIAASVIGGTAFTGGIGTLEGTFPGVMIIVILQSLMTIMGISNAGEYLSQGIVIAVMVAINQWQMQKNKD